MQSLSKKTIMTVGIQADQEISQKIDVLFVMLQTLEQHGRLLTLIAALATPAVLATSDLAGFLTRSGSGSTLPVSPGLPLAHDEV